MKQLSRRRMLAAGAAGISLAAVPVAWGGSAVAAGYGAARTRHDATSGEGRAMLVKFARAIELMRARPTGDPLSWNFQWYTHWIPDNTTKDAELARLPEDQRALAREVWNTCRAHDQGMDEGLFLPWHRAYLVFFERIARKVLDDDAFALPYWDLTDPGKRALPEAFLKPADGSNALWCAERKPEVNDGKPIDFRYNGNSPLNADALDQESYGASDVTQGLCMALDKGVHASVHVLTGTMKGMGAVQWAANDPIFWCLHTDMDQLWESWVRSGRTDPTDDKWRNAEFVFADESGRRAVSHARDFTDIADLGYRYDRLAPVQLTAIAGAAETGGGAAPESATAPPPSSAPRRRTRAAPPGNVAAAPPPPAPPALAATPATETSAVMSHGPVRVGQGGVQVSLQNAQAPQGNVAPPVTTAAPPSPGAPSGGGRDRSAQPREGAAPPLQAQAPRPSKLYIVIRHLQARAQPGVLYDVYGQVTAGGRSVTARLGSINFFDAVDHGMPGMTMQQSFASFEVTNTLALVRAPGAKLEVTIAPVGTPASGAAPVIGEISLVEKPG